MKSPKNLKEKFSFFPIIHQLQQLSCRIINISTMMLPTSLFILLGSTIPPSTSFRSVVLNRQRISRLYESSTSSSNVKHLVDEDEDALSSCPSSNRRRLFPHAAAATVGVCVSSFFPSGCNCRLHCSVVPSANAIELTQPSSNLIQMYDTPRNSIMDSFFSWNMATGMEDYEMEAQPYKTQLFDRLFDSLSRDEVPVVIEVGMGTLPNAKYYSQSLASKKLKGLEIVGVDPNDSMTNFAHENAEKSGLLSLPGTSIRTVHGVAEALPFEDNSVDAIVTTLTLCSVVNPDRALSEILRVLKPSGKYLFWEHVLSETDIGLATQQKLLNPLQVVLADGCHLTRRTGLTIQNAGFGEVDLDCITMNTSGIIGPTVVGIASKA
jgi:SAM-dependent methyltransferase